MHWCMDETLALLSVLPFIGYFFTKLHIWWHKKHHHPCHEEGCHSEHTEHTLEIKAEVTEEPIWKLAGFESEETWEKHIAENPNIEINEGK